MYYIFTLTACGARVGVNEGITRMRTTKIRVFKNKLVTVLYMQGNSARIISMSQRIMLHERPPAKQNLKYQAAGT